MYLHTQPRFSKTNQNKQYNKNFLNKKLKDSVTPFRSLSPKPEKLSGDLGALRASSGFLVQSLALLNGGALGEDQKRNVCSFSIEEGQPLWTVCFCE